MKHQYEAEDLLKKLNGGASFEELAKKNSQCPSGPHGGDLGMVKTGKADEDFEDASTRLKIGERTMKPIRTKFGYHLILRIA